MNKILSHHFFSPAKISKNAQKVLTFLSVLSLGLATAAVVSQQLGPKNSDNQAPIILDIQDEQEDIKS